MADILSLQKYYADLLILQYRNKPKARGQIYAFFEQVLMNNLPLQVQDAFNLLTAVGVQLDTLGKYIGFSRYQYDFSGPVTLTDSQYRLLLQMKILINNGGSSLLDIQTLLFQYFPGSLRVYDYRDMTMDYEFLSGIGTQQLAEVFVMSGLLPRPMAVNLRATIYNPTDAKFFGFRTNQAANADAVGFNTNAVYHMDWPWLNDTYALIMV